MLMGGLAVAVWVFWNWRPEDRLPGDALHAPEAARKSAGQAGVSRRGTEPTVEQKSPSLSAAEPPQATRGATAATIGLPGTVEALLQSPNHRPRMRDVPQWSETEQAELIRRYMATDSITNKYRIARILAFAGSPQAVPLFTNALVREFVGKPISSGEDALLEHLPELLGFLAARDDRALDFLIHGCSPKFWDGIDFWTTEGGRLRSGAWAGFCVKGLVMSDRPEAKALLDQYRDDPSLAARLQISGAMVDAAFLSDLMRDHGPMKMMDDYLYEFEDTMRYFGLWEGTANGIWWDKWHREVSRLERSQTSQP
jgi:hypothetical protein